MSECIVVFRLALSPSCRVAESLLVSGWRRCSETTYFCNVKMSEGEVSAQIKQLCDGCPESCRCPVRGTFKVYESCLGKQLQT
ncbi:MAG TPA: hypothetical protein VGP72_34050 [Planctomycetota bacterium]|jgi:hypothetical protein